MDGEPREVELKFRLDSVRGPEALAWLARGRPQRARSLTAIYFDTPACDLGGAGFALRLREEDGRWIQTVKSSATPDGSLGRGEWSSPTTRPSPDLAAARRTPAHDALGPDARLQALFTVSVERKVVEIRAPDSVIEAALDQGTVQAGERCAPVEELELELKEGPPEALFALAGRLAEAFPIELSVIAKADRGHALAAGGSLRPRRFRSPVLNGRMTAGQAFQAMARAALEQVAWNVELLREAPTSEAVHQARVGLRRLRSTLKTFRAIADDGRLAEIRAGLKRLSAELDLARNLDVFIEGAWTREAHAGPEAEAAQAALAAAYARAQRAAASPATRRTLLDTLTWIEIGPWTRRGAEGAKLRDRTIETFARAWLASSRARLLDAGDRLGRLDPGERHRMRIRAKGLRYAADVFDQLFSDHPRRGRRFLKALETLLEDLGDLNDIATGRVLASGLRREPESPDSETAREQALLAAAGEAFATFKAAKPYWKT